MEAMRLLDQRGLRTDPGACWGPMARLFFIRSVDETERGSLYVSISPKAEKYLMS